MFTTLVVRRLSVPSVYKLFAIATISAFVPITTLGGLISVVTGQGVNWNGQVLTGITALVASPFIGLLLALMFTAIWGSICVAGLWLYSKLRPLQLRVKSLEEEGVEFDRG